MFVKARTVSVGGSTSYRVRGLRTVVTKFRRRILLFILLQISYDLVQYPASRAVAWKLSTVNGQLGARLRLVERDSGGGQGGRDKEQQRGAGGNGILATTDDGRTKDWMGGGTKALSDSTRRCPYITVGAHVWTSFEGQIAARWWQLVSEIRRRAA